MATAPRWARGCSIIWRAGRANGAMVVHSIANYRGPAFTGDITILTAEVIDKMIDEEGRHLVQVDCKMANQLGTTMATAKAEIELPQKVIVKGPRLSDLTMISRRPTVCL